MSKGIITQVLTSGSYILDEIYDNTAGSILYNKLVADNLLLDESKSEKEDVETDIRDQLNDAQSQLNAAIDADQGDTSGLTKTINELSGELIAVVFEINVIQTNINNNDLALMTVISDTEVLVSKTGYCADYKDDIPIGTTVGIINSKRTDILDDPVTIQPAFRNGGTNGHLWNATRDGVLEDKSGISSSGWAYNYAMADGADTWLPRYVFATIQTIDNGLNSCTLIVSSDSIMPHGLDITLPIDATFDYMQCNSLSFTTLKQVAVDVSEENNYIVIGFRASPRNCSSIVMSATLVPYYERSGSYNPRVDDLNFINTKKLTSTSTDDLLVLLSGNDQLQTCGPTSTIDATLQNHNLGTTEFRAAYQLFDGDFSNFDPANSGFVFDAAPSNTIIKPDGEPPYWVDEESPAVEDASYVRCLLTNINYADLKYTISNFFLQPMANYAIGSVTTNPVTCKITQKTNEVFVKINNIQVNTVYTKNVDALVDYGNAEFAFSGAITYDRGGSTYQSPFLLKKGTGTPIVYQGKQAIRCDITVDLDKEALV